MTWTCHVCGEKRPDALIAVYSRDISADHGLPPGTMQQNVRYCVDRERCREGAKTFRFDGTRAVGKLVAQETSWELPRRKVFDPLANALAGLAAWRHRRG